MNILQLAQNDWWKIDVLVPQQYACPLVVAGRNRRNKSNQRPRVVRGSLWLWDVRNNRRKMPLRPPSRGRRVASMLSAVAIQLMILILGLACLSGTGAGATSGLAAAPNCCAFCNYTNANALSCW